MIGLAALLLGTELAAAAPRLVEIDGPLIPAVPCATSAPPALVAALRDGIPLRWAQANRLFPEIQLERALVRRVIVRASDARACGGRLIAENVAVRLLGPRGLPMEAVIATNLRPGVLLGVTEQDVSLAPPPGILRVPARDGFTAYGVWDLGGVRGSVESGDSPPASPGSASST